MAKRRVKDVCIDTYTGQWSDCANQAGGIAAGGVPVQQSPPPSAFRGGARRNPCCQPSTCCMTCADVDFLIEAMRQFDGYMSATTGFPNNIFADVFYVYSLSKNWSFLGPFRIVDPNGREVTACFDDTNGASSPQLFQNNVALLPGAPAVNEVYTFVNYLKPSGTECLAVAIAVTFVWTDVGGGAFRFDLIDVKQCTDIGFEYDPAIMGCQDCTDKCRLQVYRTWTGGLNQPPIVETGVSGVPGAGFSVAFNFIVPICCQIQSDDPVKFMQLTTGVSDASGPAPSPALNIVTPVGLVSLGTPTPPNTILTVTQNIDFRIPVTATPGTTYKAFLNFSTPFCGIVKAPVVVTVV